MAKFEIMNTMSRSLHRVGFKLKKHSPEILVGAGVVGTVASAVMACKATLKIDDVLEETKTNLDKINGYVEDKGYSENYTETDHKKDLTITYTKGTMELVKLYAPSVALGALSITAILAGHHILRKRNVALAAAYTAIDKSFKQYRGRVIEKFGEELDKELKYGIKAKEIQETVTNEDGTETTVTKTVNVIGGVECSDYAKFFDESCPGWTKDPEYNLMFLKDQQRYANDRLQTKGHLFLNEVYDMLGVQRTTAGAVVGWIYDEKHPIGDNFVDFGIYDIHKEKNRDFVNGYERSILLDFNVDGEIYKMI